MLGFATATKTGLGTASRRAFGDVIVGALVALNPFGDVYDPRTQQIIAGARQPGGGFANSTTATTNAPYRTIADLSRGTNTTLAVVATNVKLTKSEVTKVAQMAQDGLARTIRPAHTHFDGDTLFALSYGKEAADLSMVGALAADVLAEAVVSAVTAAEGLGGLPAARDLGA